MKFLLLLKFSILCLVTAQAGTIRITDEISSDLVAGTYECHGGLFQFGGGTISFEANGNFKWEHIYEGGVCGNDEDAIFGESESETHQGKWRITEEGSIEITISEERCVHGENDLYFNFFYVLTDRGPFLVQHPNIESFIRASLSDDAFKKETIRNVYTFGYSKIENHIKSSLTTPGAAAPSA